MIDRIDKRSEAQGYLISRLPKFSDDEIEDIKGTYDFLCINAYTSVYTRNDPVEADMDIVSRDSDMKLITYFDDTWQESASSWLRVVPWGLRKLLNWIDKTYDHPEIFVTENGVSDKGGLDDNTRITYYKVFFFLIIALNNMIILGVSQQCSRCNFR